MLADGNRAKWTARTRYTAVAALTHDPKIDELALAALDAGCFYVGELGSRNTHAKRVERLAEMGAGDADIQRIHAAVGLDIGASSTAESQSPSLRK